MTKFFGIGLNKTGTKTLGKCMQIYGFKNKTYDFELLNLYASGDIGSILSHVRFYESFEDWPWPLIYKELDKSYPDSKFILTLRKTPDIWYESLCKHSIRTGPTNARKFVYGYEMPHEYKAEHINYYVNHKSSVIKYFSDKPNKLLVVCWENGDSWEKLSAFLNMPIPKVTFPHENKSR